MSATVLDVLLWLAALPVCAASLYLLVLTLLSRRLVPPSAPPPRLRFVIVVPAHDEEAGVGATVASLLAVDYPAELRSVLVVADNCTDDTAARAREAGARVVVREDAVRRGKGYALALAFETILAEGATDAVVVVDADTVVSPTLLGSFAARIAAGAQAVQARYGVSNPDASWRTRLMAIALTLFHDVRSLGRERLACSAGLRGNGMCFTRQALLAVPHDAFSVVEDVEYGIRLGRSGHRVHYVDEAFVLGEMVSRADAARSQRRRWEGGRGQLAREHALPLVRDGILRADRVLLDLGMDLLVPPLATLAVAALLGLSASVAGSAAYGRTLGATWAWGGSVAAIVLYVARGWWLSGTGLAGLAALARAPTYVAWKLGLGVGRRVAPRDWVRTRRERRG